MRDYTLPLINCLILLVVIAVAHRNGLVWVEFFAATALIFNVLTVKRRYDGD